MTKTIKLSLAAVMAAGIATSASAQDLSKAIEGVDVSGYVDYRKEHWSTDGAKAGDVNEYSVNVTLNSKVNDIVSATVSAGFDEVTTDNAKRSDGKTSTATTDTVAPVSVDQAYFTFGLGATTVMAGKQNIPSVFVDQADTVKQGAGVVALHKVSDALTVAGAHFTNNNIAPDTKTTELLAIAKLGMVDVEAHYNKTDLGSNAAKPESTRTFLKASGSVEGIKLFGQVATADADLSTKKANVTILGASGKAGSVSLDAKYFTAKDNNVANATVAIDGDDDAKANAKVWQASTKTATDMTGFVVTAGTKIGAVDAKLVYATATDTVAGKDTDVTELMPMVTYKMSKNFTLHARYSMLSSETAGSAAKDTDKSRIQVKYTF
jgi:hypothetical protein